jgi:hypothetical protein
MEMLLGSPVRLYLPCVVRYCRAILFPHPELEEQKHTPLKSRALKSANECK